MRVLQVLPRVVRGGGAEQSLVMLAPLLMERGIQPHLAVLHATQLLVPELERSGVVVHDLSRSGESSGDLSAVPRRVQALRAVFRAVRPAVIHSTLFDADLVTRLAALGTGVPVLTTWANTTYHVLTDELPGAPAPWKRDLVRWVDEWSGRWSHSRYHAVTRGVARDGMAALHVRPDRVRVVERGRDPDRFPARTAAHRARARAALGLDAGDRVVLSVARQYPQKGHVHLLAAADLVAADRPGLVLLLAGPEGPATPAIRVAREAMAHPEVVRDLGDRSDVPELLAAADVFILSSLAEGAAGAVIEAMAVGAPVVCSRLEGLDGVLQDGSDALLARPGDPVDLARALSATLDDPAAAADRASRARQVFLDRFTLAAAADGMAALYRDLASGQF